MSSASVRHRHFIAAPLMAVLLLAVTLLDSATEVRASFSASEHRQTMLSGDTERPFSLSSGVAGVLGPASTLVLSENSPSMQLRFGTLLVRTVGRVMIDAGIGLRAEILFGAASLFRDETSVTLVALGQPVLATVSGRMWILPPGYQLRVLQGVEPQRSQVPHDWYQDALSRSASFPVSLLDQKDPLSRLSSIVEGTENISSDSVSEALRIADSFSDSSLSFLTLLRLSSEAYRLDASVSSSLSSSLGADPALDSELVFVLPAMAGATRKPLPASLITEWAHSSIRLAAKDPMAALALFKSSSASDLATRYDDAGYPKQAELWRTALANVTAVLSQVVPMSEKKAFAVEMLPLTKPVSPVLKTQNTVPSTEDLVMQTRELLDAHGVLFTAMTSINADAARIGCARVSSVFLPEAGRDAAYDFSYCPVSRTVVGIVREGVPLPNDVSVDRFFH